MAGDALLTLYLTEYTLWQARRGKHPFVAALGAVLDAAGWQLDLRSNGLEDRLASVARPGWALFYEDPPLPGRCLTLRRSYLDPFWHIERSAKRWEFDVAKARFDPDQIDPLRAQQFGTFWRKKLGMTQEPRREGYVYVPLQGRLRDHRRFQSMAPLDMVAALRTHLPDRPLVLALHPKETYGDAERAAVEKLAQDPMITLSDAPMTDLLAGCDVVATQNSSVALKGFFWNKPALLFARIDFHHIAANVVDLGLEGAIARLTDAPQPDYARYLFWFFQMQALNLWRDDFPARLTARLAAHGLNLADRGGVETAG